MLLHNRVNRKELEERLMNEPFQRATLSFYRYILLENPQEFRDFLYKEWSKLSCFGRIYIAHEGINAQMSVPQHHKTEFIQLLDSIPELCNIPLKWAVEDDGKSFYKLTIKVRPKLVADGLPEGAYDVTNVGKHLTAVEFHEALNNPDTLVVDMRNHYESEIGHFEKALCPDSDTFSEGIVKVREMLQDQKDKKILLYCTGGIRCEKASAFLKLHGFKDVNQLYGGIIEYANTIKQLQLPSKFTGKNFVFDSRLGEDVDGSVISRCHQCGSPANTHVNCANNDCHLLFIQCGSCAEKLEGCCGDECKRIKNLPEFERKKIRVTRNGIYAKSKIFSRASSLNY
jgi:UPF0176 protein